MLYRATINDRDYQSFTASQNRGNWHTHSRSLYSKSSLYWQDSTHQGYLEYEAFRCKSKTSATPAAQYTTWGVLLVGMEIPEAKTRGW